MTALLYILIIGTLFFLCTLGLLIRDRRMVMHRINHENKSADLRIHIHRIEEKLNGVRWFSEMLLSGEYGSLTDEQQEFAHEISVCADDAMRELGRAVETDIVQLKFGTSLQKHKKKSSSQKRETEQYQQ